VKVKKSKGKLHSRTDHEDPEGEEDIWLSSSTGLNGDMWSVPCPGRITPGNETRYQLYTRLGEPQGLSGHMLRVSTTLEFDPRTFQRFAIPYTLSTPGEMKRGCDNELPSQEYHDDGR